jgi:hypothetical protein
MIGGFSAACIVAGAAMATVADRHPRHQRRIETLAGVLLIAGFALLGYGFNCAFCGRP